jgi:hypothetical protein
VVQRSPVLPYFGLGDRTSQQRRVRSRSHAAPLRHAQSSSAGPDGTRRSSCGSRPREGIHGEGVDTRKVRDGDALWQGHEDIDPTSGRMGEPLAELPAVAARPGVGKGVATGWRRCPPGAQHGAKSLSGCHAAVQTVLRGRSIACRGQCLCHVRLLRSRTVRRGH